MTTSLLEPYLFFSGRCEEALEFYSSALGATVSFITRYSDNPGATQPGALAEGFENKIMHATFHISGHTLMASDGCDANTNFSGFRLSLALPTQADVERAFNALAEGGSVQMPLGKTFWSPSFGMVTDRFGLGWMITLNDESQS